MQVGPPPTLACPGRCGLRAARRRVGRGGAGLAVRSDSSRALGLAVAGGFARGVGFGQGQSYPGNPGGGPSAAGVYVQFTRSSTVGFLSYVDWALAAGFLPRSDEELSCPWQERQTARQPTPEASERDRTRVKVKVG